MNLDKLTDTELKDIILQKQLQWIKLCQDNFYYLQKLFGQILFIVM